MNLFDDWREGQIEHLYLAERLGLPRGRLDTERRPLSILEEKFSWIRGTWIREISEFPVVAFLRESWKTELKSLILFLS